MKRIKKSYRIISVALCALLFVCLVPHAAALPDYEPSELYASSEFYAALKELTLTGDGRYDTVRVALTQLGYHEGDSELDFDGMNTRGNKNFVEYNRIYGKVDNGEGNGVSYGYAWCAAFVSFCLRQAGVAEADAVTEISCPRMVKWYKAVSDRTAWQAASYTPTAGDIIFFKTGSSSAVSTHVGIVVSVSDGTIYTVEGNSGGRVGIHSYAASDSVIVGYGIPNYRGVGDISAYVFDFDPTPAEDAPGVYYTTASDGLNFRAAPSSSAAKLTEALPDQTRVEVTEVRNGWGKITYQGKTGWISMSYVINESDVVYSVYYITKYGTAPLTQRKRTGETLTISDVVPEREGYIFSGWADKSVSPSVTYRPGDTYSEDRTLELNAIWSEQKYNIVFQFEDGTVISSESYYLGEIIKQPAEPQKAADADFGYTFDGWDKEISARVTGDEVYTARFTATPLPGATTDASNDGCASAISPVTLGAIVVVALFGALVAMKDEKKKQIS